MKFERLTPSIGAEVSAIDLCDAVQDDALFAEIKALLLKHRVLFFRDQDLDRFSRADHVALARRFGPLEEHPVAGSHRRRRALLRSALPIGVQASGDAPANHALSGD